MWSEPWDKHPIFRKNSTKRQYHTEKSTNYKIKRNAIWFQINVLPTLPLVTFNEKKKTMQHMTRKKQKHKIKKTESNEKNKTPKAYKQQTTLQKNRQKPNKITNKRQKQTR